MKIIKDAIQTLLTAIGLQLFGVARSICFPLLLSPTQLGVWNLMTICIGYGANIHFGLLHGYNKLLPAYISRNNTSQVKLLKTSVRSVNLHLSIIAVSLVCAYAIFFEFKYKIELFVIAIIVFLQSIFQYGTSTLRSEQDFSVLNKVVILQSVLMTSFALIFMLIFSDRVLFGLIGVVSSFFIATLLLSKYVELTYPARFNLQTTLKTFKVGLPVFVLGIGDMILVTTDRWIVALKFSQRELGYYTLAVMFSGLLVMVASSISNVIYPRLLSAYDLVKRDVAIEKKIIATINLLSCFLLAFISILYYILPIIVTKYFPNYSNGTSVIQVSLFGVYFLSISNVSSTLVIAKNRQIWLIFLQLLSLILFGVVFVVTKRNELELREFALLVASIHATYGTGCLFAAALIIKGDVKSASYYCLTLCAPPFIIYLTLTNLINLIINLNSTILNWMFFTSLFILSIIVLIKIVGSNLRVLLKKSQGVVIS